MQPNTIPADYTLIPKAWVLEALGPRLDVLTTEYRASLPPVPQADPQYSIPQAAGLLGLSPETVRGYLKLHATHPKHPRALPFVATSDYARGHRVTLSALQAWQQRNVPGAAPLEAPARQARRRAA